MISLSENTLNMPSRLGMLVGLHDWLGLCQYSVHIPLGAQILRYLKHLICKRNDSPLPPKKRKRKKNLFVPDENVDSISFNILTSF